MPSPLFPLFHIRRALAAALLAPVLLLAACQNGNAPPPLTEAEIAAAAPALPASAAERAALILAQAATLAHTPEARAVISAALLDDSSAVVHALAITPTSTDGHALTQWAQAMFASDSVAPLGRIFMQLALGQDGQQEAPAYFSAGAPDLPHATALGYYVGALTAGLHASGANEARQHELARAVLRAAAAAAGVAEPSASLPPDTASAGARWVRFNLYAPLTQAAQQYKTPADRLFFAARPLHLVRVGPNGEPDLETASGSASRAAFARTLRRVAGP